MLTLQGRGYHKQDPRLRVFSAMSLHVMGGGASWFISLHHQKHMSEHGGQPFLGLDMKVCGGARGEAGQSLTRDFFVSAFA